MYQATSVIDSNDLLFSHLSSFSTQDTIETSKMLVKIQI